MAIQRHSSILHAEKILREVKKVWPKGWDGWLKHWSNGREQGYYLEVSQWNRKKNERCSAACVFSEGRSCDGALVIVGRTYHDFDYGTNMPTDEAWENRAYFHDTTGLKQMWSEKLEGRGDKLAAQHIVKELRRLMREDIKRQREEAKEHKAKKKGRKAS